ncbi:hypothetical protein BH11BAC4_BH11BAC4_04660 [soil metagenome]
MKVFFLNLVLLIAISSTGQSQDSKGSAEPKSTFEVKISGKTIQLSEDEVLAMDTTLVNPVISIKLSEYKKFDNGSMSFQYPRNLSFEFEQDFGYKNWTFSGNSLVVLVFELDAKTTVTTLVDEMVKKFGKKNCSIEDFEKELGHKKWTGKRLNVSLAGQKLRLDCFEIKLDDFKSRFIYFQDSLEAGANSAEYLRGFNIIDSTIHFR